MNKIDDCLNLSPIIKDYIEYQLLEQDKEKGKYTIKSGMNFITWLWGSGKTFFIEETLKYFKNPENHLWEPKDYLWKRKFIRIDFSPRNLETTGSIYSHFLDTFISELLSKKYDPNLKGYKSNLLKILGAWTGNNYLDIFFKLFNSPSENVQDILKSINDSLQTTYKDYFIVVVIDDIDRVEKKDLLNIGKILNLLKNLTDIQKENKDKSAPNLICLYSADSNYLNNFYLWDLQEEKGINFYQYFNKFRDSQIDIYEATYKNLITFLNNSFKNVNDKDNSSDILGCEELFSSLKEREIAVTIRDLLFLKKEILGKFQKNINEAKIELVKYSDIIPPEEVNSYFYFWNGRIDLFLLYLYTKSVYEIDSNILSDLDKAIPKREENNDKDEMVKKIKKENHFFSSRTTTWRDLKTNYNLIKQLINNQNNTNPFKDYIINCWIKSIAKEMKEENLQNNKNFHNIVKRLFSTQNSLIFGVMKEIFYNTYEYSNVIYSNVLENYIQIISELFKNISKYNRNTLFQRDGFFQTICQDFSNFTSKEWILFKILDDTDSNLREKNVDTIEKFFKEIQSNNDTEHQFICLYLLLMTFYKKANRIAERFDVTTIIEDKPAFIWNLTQNFFNILPRSSSDKKEKQIGLIMTWWTILYYLIHYPQWKDLPLFKLFGEEASLLILIYSIINIIKDWRMDVEPNQDIKQKECYTKIYQELLKSQKGNIKRLIKKLKIKILIRYREWQDSRWALNTDFLSNLEDKISIEDISDNLNSSYWQDSN